MTNDVPQQLLHKVWFTRGVESVVSFGGTPSPVDDDVIEFFRTRADKDGFIKVGEELKPGDRVVRGVECLTVWKEFSSAR